MTPGTAFPKMTESVAVIVMAGAFLPFLAAAKGVRAACWTYLFLIPLFMYHKSLFATVQLAGIDLQWPTLAKDVAALGLIGILSLGHLSEDRPLLLSGHRRALSVLAMFAAYWVVSAGVLGQTPSDTVMGVRPYAYYAFLGLLLGAVIFRERGATARLAAILLCVSLIVAVIALIQRYVAPRFLIHPAMQEVWVGRFVEWRTGGARIQGYFTSPNVLGFFMGTGVLAGLWTVRERPGSGWRYLATAAVPIFLWVLALTLSRTALLATAAATFLLVLCMQIGPRAKGIISAGAVAILLTLIVTTAYAERFSAVTDNPRLLYWAAYLAASVATPVSTLFGHGVGSVGRFGAEIQAGGVSVQAVAEQIGTADVFFVDNFFIRSFYETGLVGLGFVVWALWLFGKGFLWVSRRQAVSVRARSFSLLVALMGFILLISFLTSALGTFPWNLLFWTCASGLLLVWSRTRETSAVRVAPSQLEGTA